MKVTLTRPLHPTTGELIPAGTTLDREDGETLVALGGAVAAEDDATKASESKSTRKNVRSE